ncbi:hypothetical protein GE061_008587 [Apolygus lucorum]|uniref:ORC1/DEAH AAA+ ATPase domain-containing protein n=1 Tax=Apolygus lucorum TaxID=248454 RepID=A0A8S9WN42_APOLU|nr:hypothetical protein GE061_008587 [Apolygus lucorum]
MGSNCSSSHKDDDSSSRKSQESPSYQLSNKDGDGKKMDDGGGEPKSSVGAGVILSVKSPPEHALPPQPMPSVSDSMMTASPAHKPKEPEVVQAIRPSILDLPPVKDAKIVIYICAADSQDCKVEKSLVHNEVFPGLREKCRSKGFELHIVDLHWSIQDRTAEPAELCLQELARQNENSYLIPLVFLNHFLGTPLLPKTLENADFQTVTSEERSGLLLKWYRLDSTAQPPCYTLQPPVTHIPDLKSADKDVRDRALQQWRKEVDSILTVMLAAFSQELRDTYLSTVVEQEVQHTVLMSQELAKRCVWISRGGKVPDLPTSPGDQELRRRLEALQKTLKGELSESHMIHVVPAASPDHSEQPEYIQQVTTAVSKQLDSIVDAIFEDHDNKVDQLRMSSDLDMRVITEVTAHARAALRYSQSSVNRQCDLEKALNDSGDGAVVLHGPQGSGKTTLLCKLGNQLETEADVILRLVGLTAASSTLVQVLRSITDQLCPATVPRPHNLKAYTAIFNDSLAEASKRGKTVIIIDGIDQFRDFGENCISWVPPSLPPNVKLVFSCSEGQILDNLKNHLNGTNAKFIPILDLSKKEMETILLHNILEYNHSVNPIVKDCISNSVDSPPLPLYVNWNRFRQRTGGESIQPDVQLKMGSTGFGTPRSADQRLPVSHFDHVPSLGRSVFVPEQADPPSWPVLLFGDHRTLKLRDSAVIEVSRQRYDRRTIWATKTLKDYFLVIEDAYMENTTDDITWLMNFLSDNAESLTYDGKQLYAQVHRYAKNHNPTTLSNVWKRIAVEPPTNTLLEADVHEEEKPETSQLEGFNIVQRLPKTHNFVVSVRTNLGEISIWDIAKCQRVRHLTGLTQPAAIEMVDDCKCVVLCNRELYTYDLDKGVIITKLKGVMNQKMPFFGLHDSNHLVALSRNRMYVNMMNLDTGDCVTTFKAGEDRFLNSLLVSADGKTLVCGDETQKPFPLLVWNLASRKLLYDLRIPQHEFLSRLSAITPQGNYVCCVAKEVVDNTPNYIVVYDLQSGTLFKKWKPAVNTTSIDISHTESCLVSGHVSSKILSWSLGTGNCRYSLSGHTAPVDFLRLSPNGKMCLSMNKEGRDRSIRIWDIAKGSLIAVFTPDSPVMSCELTDAWVVISVLGNPNLVCLEIRGPDFPSKRVNEIYGTPEAS